MDGQDEGSRRIYNQRDLTKRRTTIRKTPESSSCVVSKEEKKNSSSDEARGWTLTPPNYVVDNPAPQRSCPTVDEVLAKAQFLSPLLYQIHCIGPIGFGFAHIYSKRHPPNQDPTCLFFILMINIKYISFYVLCKCFITNINILKNIFMHMFMHFPPLSPSVEITKRLHGKI